MTGIIYCETPGCTNRALENQHLCAACLATMTIEHLPPLSPSPADDDTRPVVASSLEDLERDYVGHAFSAANRHDPALIIREQQRTIQDALQTIQDLEGEVATYQRRLEHAEARIVGLEEQNAGLDEQLQAYINGAALCERDARRAEQQDGGLLDRIRRLITR